MNYFSIYFHPQAADVNTNSKTKTDINGLKHVFKVKFTI